MRTKSALHFTLLAYTLTSLCQTEKGLYSLARVVKKKFFFGLFLFTWFLSKTYTVHFKERDVLSIMQAHCMNRDGQRQ